MQVLELLVSGAVQGVGFRPLVYRIANQLRLGGAVWNEPAGVRIRIVGPARQVEEFGARLRAECEAPARIDQIRILSLSEAEHAEPFIIAESGQAGARDALVMPDLATCPACRRELFDSRNRRHRYPFINCTHCGPRYSIMTGMPYDRAQTSMHTFTMCAACRAEYENPEDRRFHAQPNACPACGPQVELWDINGARLGARDWAVRQAAAHLRAGQIVAVKGVGGFHLMCDARNETAVRELRRRKRREEKPLAVMVPNMVWARRLAEVGEAAAQLLESAAAPIVLLPHRGAAGLAPDVAPGNPNIGIMLPYAPLHHLLMHDLEIPIVATSGNLTDEPICIDEHEAVKRLSGIADFYLVHDRPIVRPLDDSVAQLIDGRPALLRRARGYAPLAIPLPFESPPLLALGGHLKNTVALAMRDRVVLSQHLGDLDTLESRRAFEQAVASLAELYGETPATWVCDAHPDYASTHYALEQGRDPVRVQHHHAHVAAVMAEHTLPGPVLGVAWDGTGYGEDGTIWGGEFFRAMPDQSLRIARLDGFHLPGGDNAMRKPLWSAFGALHAAFPGRMPELAVDVLGLDADTAANLQVLLENPRTAPFTSSAGRWFDVVAALAGVCRESAYEGQAAQCLEFSAVTRAGLAPYPFQATARDGLVVFEFKPMLEALLADRAAQVAPGVIAVRFHLMLVEIIVSMADGHRGWPVVLAGGCFQNRLLLQRAIKRLRDTGHVVKWPELVPPNDGAISLGQAATVAYRKQ
ncbi:MAG TPA: carbamoyltransferase HypF [Kiritimatiellia bacterium]|nr:carbamoyltransferase HypF [Kiritimatiellia bacterium]